MRTTHWIGLAALLVAPPSAAASPHAVPPRVVQTIPLPGVNGRIDHMALDPAGRRLFVAALGNRTVEVVDLRAGRRVKSLAGFDEPQGVAFAPAPPRLVVSDGGDGTCRVFDGATLRPLRTIRLGDDADNLRLDARPGRVAVGFGSGALAMLDVAAGRVLARIPLAGHPEAFELDPARRRAFVNVPGAHEIAVVDLARGRVAAHWPLKDAADNYPLALDPWGAVYVGCRRPPVLRVFHADSGLGIGAVPIDGDADDLWLDAATRRLYVSCGAGFLDVFFVPTPDAAHPLQRLPTAPGARTSLLDPARGRLYLAVPRRGGQGAEIRVFEVASR